MANFVVEFQLKAEKYQEDVLDKRFEIGRQIYNSLVDVAQKRYTEMMKTEEHRILLTSLSGDRWEDKPIWRQIYEICNQYGISEFSLQKDVKQMQQHFKDDIDTATAQKIATKVWRAYCDLFNGCTKEVRHQTYEEFDSLEGKQNKSGIRFRDGVILWKGLEIPVVMDCDNHEHQPIQRDNCYCRIVRKSAQNKYKYCVQIVFKDTEASKIAEDRHKKTWEKRKAVFLSLRSYDEIPRETLVYLYAQSLLWLGEKEELIPKLLEFNEGFPIPLTMEEIKASKPRQKYKYSNNKIRDELGLSGKEIPEVLTTSKEAREARRIRMGGKTRKQIAEAHFEQAKKLYFEGKTRKEMMAELGLSEAQIKRYRKRIREEANLRE